MKTDIEVLTLPYAMNSPLRELGVEEFIELVPLTSRGAMYLLTRFGPRCFDGYSVSLAKAFHLKPEDCKTNAEFFDPGIVVEVV